MGDVKGSLEDWSHLWNILSHPSPWDGATPLALLLLIQIAMHSYRVYMDRVKDHVDRSKKHTVLLLESEELDSRLSPCATIKKLSNFPEPRCSLL